MRFGRKHLPWRNKNMTPYKIWVSEIMLQQTQVDRVVHFYRRFLKRFPSVKSLANASWDEFLPYYQGLGYYNRGRNMLKAVQVIMTQYHGRFPRNLEDLEALPGVGEYTARAILSFAHAHDHMAWDTNFNRVFGRFFYGSKDAEIKKDFFEDTIKSNKRDFNGAIMDFGSLVCMKKPNCSECNLAKKCVYFAKGGKQEKTTTKKTSKFPTREAQVYILLHQNHQCYYSSNKTRFKPFMLSKKYNTREGIKEYFKKKYKLQLAVRPPKKKVYIQGKPTLIVYAQVLLGKHEFHKFTKKEVGASIT
jgi:A/G-specific adenine glycosylase